MCPCVPALPVRSRSDCTVAALPGYAAEQWVTHARVENVASRVRDGVEHLFGPDKPQRSGRSGQNSCIHSAHAH
jgi:hypothetical protein